MEEKSSFSSLVENYRKEFLAFYEPFFAKKEELEEFVDLAFNYDEKNTTVRLMIQQVQQLVSLANDIEKIRPERDPLRILFIKICMDSLCKTAYRNNSESKKKLFYAEFEDCFSTEGKQYILGSFKYQGLIEPEKLSFEKYVKYSEWEVKEFTLTHFLNLLKAARDLLAHEGDYWSIKFFSPDENEEYLCSFSSDVDFMEFGNTDNKVYLFHTSMVYERFVFYFMKACISFINNRRNKLPI